MDQVRTIILQEIARLRRFAYSLTGSAADADDLVQNVVVRVLKSGLPAGVAPVPWMLKICKNLWIDEIRAREVRMKAVNDELLTENLSTGECESELYLDTQKILQAISTLPDKQRLALSLVAIESLSYAEAAEVLEVPIGTIMSRVARARARLLEQFNGKRGALI